MSFNDLEDVLGNATPLPCSVDPMQLMFDAGAEEQKRRNRVSRAWAISTASTSVVLMMTTLGFAAWSYQLSNENSRLTASLEQVDADSGRSQREDDKTSTEKSSDSKSQSKTQSTEQKPNGRSNSQESSEVPRQLQRNDWRLTLNELDRSFHLRGVALDLKDEYREPVRSGQGAYLTNSDPMAAYPGASNLNLRQKMQEDLWGP